MVLEAIDCKALGEPLLEGDALGPHCQGPVLVRWVEDQSVFWVLLVIDGVATDGLRTVPVPAWVRTVFAGGAEDLAGAFTGRCAVIPAAGSTCVLFGGAVASKVSPASALHALYWFVLLLIGSDSCTAYNHAISYQEIGGFRG